MNRIIYSPYFDQATYNGVQKGTACGDRIVGTSGLLSELELRAGMTHPETSPFERLIAWYRAVRRAISTGSKPFYAESFAKDDLSVAGELLRWRDALIMSGWNHKVAEPSNPSAYKFNDLSSIEPYFNVKGAADRWHDLLAEPGFLAGTTVEVLVPEKSLDRVIVDVLRVSGAAVSYIDPVEGSALKIGCNLEVIPFRNRVDAYRWVSTLSPAPGLVLVNRDNKAFNDVLRGADLPLVSADYTDSNPLTLQLFKLGFSLYRKDVDIRTLISYLQVPFSPVKRELRKSLLRHLLNTGGMGEGWDDILSATEDDCPELKLVGKCTDSLSRENLERYSEYLGNWAEGYAQMLRSSDRDQDIAEQMMALSQMCSAMKILLGEGTDDVSTERLKKWVDGIYSSCSFSADRAQAGSFDVIPDIKGVVASPEHLIWLDCNAGADSRYPLYFLSNAELQWLRSKGITPVDEEEFARSSNIAVKQALSKVSGSITLLVSQKAYGVRCDEHPVLTEIKALGINFNEVESPVMPEGVSLKVCTKAEEPVQLELSKGIKVPQREHGESYSSIDTMIQRPVDYVLDYILKLREVDMGQVADIAIIKGNVAHAVIEHCAGLLNNGGFDSQDEGLLSGIIDRFARDQGQLLYNNGMEYGSFKLKLTQSVKSLMKMISDHGLTVFGTEYPVEVELPALPDGKTIGLFNARIDMILQDSRGDFIIIDMKWSESRRFRDKVESQTALQLALYAKALKAAFPEKTVLGSAYYVIPQYKLETSDPFFRGWDVRTCDQVEIPAGDRYDIYGEAVRSYCFRKEQLSRGLLENGELHTLSPEDFEYMKAIDDGADLYPLDADWETGQLKAEAYGSKNYVLKGRSL